MPRKPSEQLTPVELDIMQVLWEAGPATVQTVRQRLPREAAYTTVQTMLNVLLRKGKVKRTLKDRAYVYKPVVSRRQIVSQAIGDIVERLFGGSPEELVMSMVETKHLTPDKLEKLKGMLEAHREERDDRA
ncbi:MAG TPA: BlaI/MecI/CopY family transcriptional regulator [Pyrinomonadaceae bacterium]|nr:BlaI/MecI/CopY family transcriptional regulator [Pyrinomonadaceae bacterium]